MPEVPFRLLSFLGLSYHTYLFVSFGRYPRWLLLVDLFYIFFLILIDVLFCFVVGRVREIAVKTAHALQQSLVLVHFLPLLIFIPIFYAHLWILGRPLRLLDLLLRFVPDREPLFGGGNRNGVRVVVLGLRQKNWFVPAVQLRGACELLSFTKRFFYMVCVSLE